jgi:methionyl-tRNA synthetase
MDAAAGVNVYLNATEPWRTAKDDRARTATTLFVALQAISGLRTAFAPYLPFSTESLGEMLSLPPLDKWTRPEIAAGTPLGQTEPLFRKVEGELEK